MDDVKNYGCEAVQSPPELRNVITRLKNLDDRISFTSSEIHDFADRLMGATDAPAPALLGAKAEPPQSPVMVDMCRTIESLEDRVSYLQDQFRRISDIA